MDKEQLLEYLNDSLVEYNNLIASKVAYKINLDTNIDRQQGIITDLEKQKTQADVDIASYNANKLLVDEIIVIVEAS